MQNEYFYWLDKFKNTSIKTHDMAVYSSFDEFRDNHINELLKGCYVKDLLAILNGLDSTIFNKKGQCVYKEIQESIGRRNVHVHNNGIADKTYIIEFNIYNLQEGTFLTIDERYVLRVQSLTQMIVDNIACRFIKESPCKTENFQVNQGEQ